MLGEYSQDDQRLKARLKQPHSDLRFLGNTFRTRTRNDFDAGRAKTLINASVKNLSPKAITAKFSQIFNLLFSKESITLPDPVFVEHFDQLFTDAAHKKRCNKNELLKQMLNSIKAKINFKKIKIDTSERFYEAKLAREVFFSNFKGARERPEHKERAEHKIRSVIFLIAVLANPHFRSVVEQFTSLNMKNANLVLEENLDSSLRKNLTKLAIEMLSNQAEFDINNDDELNSFCEALDQSAGEAYEDFDSDLSKLSFEILLEELEKLFNAGSYEELEQFIFPAEKSEPRTKPQKTREVSQTIHQAKKEIELDEEAKLKKLYRGFVKDLSSQGSKNYVALYQRLFFDERCPLLYKRKLSKDRDLQVMEAFFMKKFLDHFDNERFSLKAGVNKLFERFFKIFHQEIIKKPELSSQTELDLIPKTPVLLKKGLSKVIQSLAKSNKAVAKRIERVMTTLSRATSIQDLQSLLSSTNVYTYVGDGALGGYQGIRLGDNYRLKFEFKDKKFYVLDIDSHDKFDKAK